MCAGAGGKPRGAPSTRRDGAPISILPHMTSDSDQLCVDSIRALAMDAIQKANSGHPGLPMAMAPAAVVLYRHIMRHDPADPTWPDRDRFLLSAGHGSMLLYAILHLTGYDLPMDEIKNFRQWGSLTPGHPERDRVHVTPGVEVDDRAAGRRLLQRRRHGDRREVPARALRRGRPEPPHLRDRLRRRPHGGHRRRGGLAGRAARPRPDRLPLRRQRHLARRPDVAELRPRGRREALRGLRLACLGRPRRQRHGRARDGDQERAEGRGQAVAHPREVDHRLPVAQQVRARARRTAPRSARTRCA